MYRSIVSEAGNGAKAINGSTLDGRRVSDASKRDRPGNAGERQDRMTNKWVLPLVTATLISILLFCCVTFAILSTRGKGVQSLASHSLLKGLSHHHGPPENLVEEPSSEIKDRPPTPPRVAYLISGSSGDGNRMLRLVKALYHPRNEYLLHLDLEAPVRERVLVARNISLDKTYREVKNVHIIAKANLVTYRGATMIANTLHGISILLRQHRDWDWFINLSAADYPLISQDDFLHVLSYLPRDLNFLEHTKRLGWKEAGRAKPIMLDPGIYTTKKADVFFVTQRRTSPTAFKLYTGSAWMMLSRKFSEFVTQGYDNLPRLLLMYYTNFVSSPEGYFHTVICNAPEFKNTTVNDDLHFITWDNPPKQHPTTVTMRFWPNITTGIPFARKFPNPSDVLDRLDKEILHRAPGQVTPGGWCIGPKDGDPCSVRGDPTVLRPGFNARKFEAWISGLLAPNVFRPRQCTEY